VFEGLVCGRVVRVQQVGDGYEMTVSGRSWPGRFACVADALRAAETSLARVEDSL
jgi:3-oxoacyl-(acyl-carrier-protein) synthase